jgi:hypothetical protein
VCYALIVFAYVKVFAKTHTNADYWKDHQKASARLGLECAVSVSTSIFYLLQDQNNYASFNIFLNCKTMQFVLRKSYIGKNLLTLR